VAAEGADGGAVGGGGDSTGDGAEAQLLDWNTLKSMVAKGNAEIKHGSYHPTSYVGMMPTFRAISTTLTMHSVTRMTP
jgi:hypothetical protein